MTKQPIQRSKMYQTLKQREKLRKVQEHCPQHQSINRSEMYQITKQQIQRPKMYQTLKQREKLRSFLKAMMGEQEQKNG